jgi:hypothetical protein
MLAILASLSGTIVIADDATNETRAVSACEVLRMCPEELAALYQSGSAATLPDGRLRGTAIVRPGTTAGPATSRVARFVWQGKIIDNTCGTGVNKFFGVRAVRAQVAAGESWMDSKPATILDYRGSSRVYAHMRDEVRQVAPDLYLGLMYKQTCCGPKLQMYFLLEPLCCCE